MFLKKVALASALAITAGTAHAGCEISGNVSIIGNEFPAIHTGVLLQTNLFQV